MASHSNSSVTIRAGIAAAAALIVPLSALAAPAAAFPAPAFTQISLVSTIVAANVVAPLGTCEGDESARILDTYAPVWPDIAKEQGAEGTTTLRVRLDGTGQPAAVAVASSSGNPLLDDEALHAARMSRFAPDVRCGHVIAGTYELGVAFYTER